VWVNPDVQPRTKQAARRIQLRLEFGPLPRMNRRQRRTAELTPNHPPSRTQWTDDSMATYITEDCINCGACEPECPNEAISEGDEIYIIDPELCTECVGFYDHEACQAVCPVECCLPNPQIVESEELLIARAIKLHPDDAELKKRAEANDYPSRFRK
jgi:ferredoxin